MFAWLKKCFLIQWTINGANVIWEKIGLSKERGKKTTIIFKKLFCKTSISQCVLHVVRKMSYEIVCYDLSDE